MFDLKKLVLSISFALCLSAGAVHATVYNVTNTTDGLGLDQLRGALTQAGKTAGTHTVNISAGTYYVDYGLILIGTASNATVTIKGAGIGSTIIDARQLSRAFVADPANNHVNFKVNFEGLTFQNCKSTSTTGGGAVLALGREGSFYSFDNCAFLNNTATNPTSAASGGAILCGVSSFSITNCLFYNNISESGDGGAVKVEFPAGVRGVFSGSATIANSVFTSNSGSAEFARGGAIFVQLEGFGGTYSTTVTENTFTSNSVPYGSMSAIGMTGYLENSPVKVNYNRFSGNTASPELSDRGAVYIFGIASPLDAKNNWWGCNDGATGCADRGVCGVSSAGDIFSPYLQLKTTTDAGSICYGTGNTVQISGGFTSNSANVAIDASNLGALIGRPISFLVPNALGNLSGTQMTIQPNGMATRTFTANGTPGTGYIQSLCDGTVSEGAPLTVNIPGSWLGTSSADWDVPANWCGGAVPTSGTNVNIPAGTPHAPTIGSTSAVANNVTIVTGATLTQAAFSVMHVKGVFTNNGTFYANASGAITAFSGAAAQTIPGGDYATLAVDGGVSKTLGADVTAHAGFLFTGNTKVLLGNHTLTLESGARFTGNNASNYIVTNGTGGVRKKSLGSMGFTFPIGLETSHSPVAVSNDGTLDHFTARVGNGVYLSYVNDVPQGSAISEKGVNRTWYISEDTPGESNAIVTVGWTDVAELASFVRSNCFISHYENNKWDVVAGTATIGTNTYFQSRSGITSFSPFAVTNPDSPLPVTLARFDAVKEGSTALLSWSTTEETNSDRFEVEHSLNGKVWQKIGTVRANGESKVWTDYRFADEQPVPSTENFYRLKLIDRGAAAPGAGVFAYSRIKSVKFEGDNNPVVFPNPVNDKLFVQDFTHVSSLRVIDVSGKVVYQSETMKTDAINVDKITAGVHLVEIKWLDGRKSLKKIIINP